MEQNEIDRVIQVIKTLHDPQKGCPWDLKQTHRSLLPYLIEEAYEFIDSVEQSDSHLMEEEIGDVLLQVLHHCALGEKNHQFSIYSVAKKLADKMIHRHPHVFNPTNKKLTADEVTEKWRALKAREKSLIYHMDKKLLHFPSLESAYRIGKKSTELNFDWSNYHQVVHKVEEEWQEVKSELPPGDFINKDRVKEEIGDLLFSVAQLARHLDLNPEECLKMANEKFIKRFQKIEDKLKQNNKTPQNSTQEELEELWTMVKSDERD
jgi:MazG family protein